MNSQGLREVMKCVLAIGNSLNEVQLFLMRGYQCQCTNRALVKEERRGSDWPAYSNCPRRNPLMESALCWIILCRYLLQGNLFLYVIRR